MYQPTNRDIRYLRDVEGLTFAQIATQLGITPQAVWQAYQRDKQQGGRPRKPPRKPHKYQ